MAKRVYAVAIFFPDNKYCRYKSGLDCEIRTTGMGIPVRKLLTKTVFYEMEIYDSAYTDWADPSGKMYQLFFTRIR